MLLQLETRALVGRNSSVQFGFLCQPYITYSLWLCRIKTAGKEILNQRLCCMHPNIIQLHEVFLTPEHLGIVSEYAPGGDLVDYIERHNMAYDRALMENEARWLFQQLIVAVDYCHQVSSLCERKPPCCPTTLPLLEVLVNILSAIDNTVQTVCACSASRHLLCNCCGLSLQSPAYD